MKKHVLVACLLTALPLTAFGAGHKHAEPMSQNIQVVKAVPDASAVTSDAISGISNAAETKDDEPTTRALSKAISKSLAYRVSSTATPEVNRMIREEMGQTIREVKSVSVPDANAFEDRKAVGVAPATITLDHMDISYPTVTSVSPVVQGKINSSLFGYVKDLRKELETENMSNSDKKNLVMYYDVKTDGKGILSILIHTYTIMDHGTEGDYYVKGMTYNTTTGRLLSLSDFGGIDTQAVNKAIQGQEAVAKQFNDSFTGFVDRPKEFYAHEDTSVVLLAQASHLNRNVKKLVEIPVGVLRVDTSQADKKSKVAKQMKDMKAAQEAHDAE